MQVPSTECYKSSLKSKLRKTFRRGEYLYLPTDSSENIFVIHSGIAKIGSYSSKGYEVTYDVVTSGELAGNLQYLPGNIFSEFAKAMTDIETTVYKTSVFKDLIKEDAGMGDWFHQVVVRRWCRAEARLFSIASDTPAQRVQTLLIRFAEKITHEKGCGYCIKDLLTQKDIADLTGLTRQTTARILRKLTQY